MSGLAPRTTNALFPLFKMNAARYNERCIICQQHPTCRTCRLRGLNVGPEEEERDWVHDETMVWTLASRRFWLVVPRRPFLPLVGRALFWDRRRRRGNVRRRGCKCLPPWRPVDSPMSFQRAFFIIESHGNIPSQAKATRPRRQLVHCVYILCIER